jgi:hypothetical protein
MTLPLARPWPGPRPCPEPDPGLLPGMPWSVRLAGGPGTRPVVEIYEAGSLAGLIVATHVAPQILAGARRAARDGQAFALAWGRCGDDGPVTVTFSRGLLRRRTRPAAVTSIGGGCWLAAASGRFDAVSASRRGIRESRRLARGSSW